MSIKYQEVNHCHLDPHHGRPRHNYKKGTARCPWCGWTTRLRKGTTSYYNDGHSIPSGIQGCELWTHYDQPMPVSIQRGGGWSYK